MYYTYIDRSGSILSAPFFDPLDQVEAVARLGGVAPPEGVGWLLLLWRAGHSDKREIKTDILS